MTVDLLHRPTIDAMPETVPFHGDGGRRMSVEVLVPAAELSADGDCVGIVDARTRRTAWVASAGLVLVGATVCARVAAFDVDGDDYLVWADDGFVVRVHPVDAARAEPAVAA